MRNTTLRVFLSRADTKALEFDWQLIFAREPIKLASEYWHSRRGAFSMPARADLNPAAMRKFTAHIGLVEIRHDEAPHVEYFIRRAGGKWEDVFGTMTGRFIHEFLPPQIETRWRQVFDVVGEKKKPLRVATGIHFQGKTWLSTEMFVAPLGQAGEPDMLFVAFDSWSRMVG
jgi:hypothetical protein